MRVVASGFGLTIGELLFRVGRFGRPPAASSGVTFCLSTRRAPSGDDDRAIEQRRAFHGFADRRDRHGFASLPAVKRRQRCKGHAIPPIGKTVEKRGIVQSPDRGHASEAVRGELERQKVTPELAAGIRKAADAK